MRERTEPPYMGTSRAQPKFPAHCELKKWWVFVKLVDYSVKLASRRDADEVILAV